MKPSFALLILLATLVAFTNARAAESPSRTSAIAEPDIIVVGAGIAGLSAALEGARDGATVLVVDMASVFGGHAVMSEADLTMVDTPVQRAWGLKDSPDLAYKDFIRWGDDNNREWVRYYVEHSRSEIYDWLTALGVVFDGLRQYPGNSVPRAHKTRGLGLGLVAPVYRVCLANPDISFVWNAQVTDLIVDTAHVVVGAHTRNTRTGETGSYHARAVILATGGFQSNLALVRQHWPQNTPVPERLLAGSGVHSMGSGLELASKVGGAIRNLDHQWNYQRGLPDPRYPGAERGLNVAVGDAIWVNAQGLRFVNEDASSPTTLQALLQQHPATYWAVFDAKAKANIWVSGTGWNRSSIEHWIVDNPKVLKRGNSLAELARQTGLPAAALATTVASYNALLSKGQDTQFKRFDRQLVLGQDLPAPIKGPPFYALQFFPLTRKSMGGIAIDSLGRVIDEGNRPIAGLYAAGEAAGLAGINGKAALEGTFLAPSVLTGRVAGRSAAADISASRNATYPYPSAASAAQSATMSSATSPVMSSATPPAPGGAPTWGNSDCIECHNLTALVATPRPGYWHFERAHQLILERKLECAQCHAEMTPKLDPAQHRINRLSQSQSCSACHASQ
jgi:uncharacterized protein